MAAVAVRCDRRRGGRPSSCRHSGIVQSTSTAEATVENAPEMLMDAPPSHARSPCRGWGLSKGVWVWVGGKERERERERVCVCVKRIGQGFAPKGHQRRSQRTPRLLLDADQPYSQTRKIHQTVCLRHRQAPQKNPELVTTWVRFSQRTLSPWWPPIIADSSSRTR